MLIFEGSDKAKGSCCCVYEISKGPVRACTERGFDGVGGDCGRLQRRRLRHAIAARVVSTIG